jgi:hypothetical protein
MGDPTTSAPVAGPDDLENFDSQMWETGAEVRQRRLGDRPMELGLDILIDNTTLHRLAFAVEGMPERIEADEVTNILHLLECLILASDILVNGFESTGSRERSEAILNWLQSSGQGALVQVSPMSDADSQRRIAALVAREMYDRGLLTPEADQISELDQINVALGRPHGVVEISESFWSEAVTSGKDLSRLAHQAHMAVEQYRTDGLFVYGTAQHEDVIDHLFSAYDRGEAPDDDRWRKMHVVFRSLFNQRLAEESASRSYAPPPVRSDVLNTIYSNALKSIERAMSETAVNLNVRHGNNDFADEILAEAHRPLPLLGLAFMLEATSKEPTAPFVARLEIARELARPMRERLNRIEGLAKDKPAKYARKSEEDASLFAQIAHSKLGLDTQGLAFEYDLGVSFDTTSNSFSVNVGQAVADAVKALTNVKRMSASHRKRVSVLSNGISRTIQYRSVEEALRQAVS